MSFSTEVELSLTVPQSELRSVRGEIESGLGDMEMGVSGGGSRGSARADGGNRNRRMFRWARQRTRDMDTTVTLLESIDDALDEDGGLLGGGRGGGGGGLPTVLPVGGGGGGGGGKRLPRPGGSGGLAGILRNFAMSTGVLAQPFVNNKIQTSDDSPEELANRGPIQSFFADLGATFGINDAGTSFFDQAGGGNQSAQQQRNAELLRRQQMQNLTAPQWMRDFLQGNANAPEWIERGPNQLFDTPSGQRAPDRPGGADRIRINFENTIESEFGMSPDELRQRIEEVSQEKADELRRELARETGRGVGGTPIP